MSLDNRAASRRPLDWAALDASLANFLLGTPVPADERALRNALAGLIGGPLDLPAAPDELVIESDDPAILNLPWELCPTGPLSQTAGGDGWAVRCCMLPAPARLAPRKPADRADGRVLLAFSEPAGETWGAAQQQIYERLAPAVPDPAGHHSVVFEIHNHDGDGLALTSLPQDVTGVDSGMWLCPVIGRKTLVSRVPFSGGERVELTLEEGLGEGAPLIHGIHHAYATGGRGVFELNYRIARK